MIGVQSKDPLWNIDIFEFAVKDIDASVNQVDCGSCAGGGEIDI